MKHPISEAVLQRFVAGRASRAESKAVVAHLIRGCPLCSRQLAALVHPGAPSGGYDSALDAFAEGFLDDLEDFEDMAARGLAGTPRPAGTSPRAPG